MRLLFVHERFGAMAGAEVNALATATALKRRGHTIGMLHGVRTGRQEDLWEETFSHRYSYHSAQPENCARAALEQFEPDIAYIHKLADLRLLSALLASNRPMVRMVHDHDLYCLRSYKYNPLTRRICARAASGYCVFPCGATLARKREGWLPFKWVSYTAKRREIELNRRMHRMIVATQYMADELVRNSFDPRKIEIHAPVPRVPEQREQASFSERNLIVCAGQVIRGKGVDVLIESLARLRVNFECVIIGDGNHRPYCEKLCRRLGLGGRVRFEGYVPQAKLREYYADASVAAMGSVWPEPFGAAGLEAMHHGLPVVAFDSGGIREWLIDEHNGLLIPWMDRPTFAAGLERLLKNKTLARQMGERGRALVKQKFDFNGYIDRLENMFAQVLLEHHLNHTDDLAKAESVL
jgi:glycosyltransferase involved in cell wall biosynthesis